MPYNRTVHQSEGLIALEKAGEVPENDRDLKDWQLAQNTSWWGKPLDPKEFWKGRILWNDAKATSDAQRHGRLYPPIPYEDTNLPPYPNDEGIHGTWLPDSPNIFYASSSKERAFWDRFDKTHPCPPDQIEREQELTATAFLRSQRDSIRNEPVQRNYPPEAFSENALFWDYAEMKRAEYQQMLDNGNTKNEPIFQTFFSNLLIDRKFITEPLTPEKLQAANAWKVAYLQRLRRENTDEQYVQGYMQAWNLSSNEVFGQ